MRNEAIINMGKDILNSQSNKPDSVIINNSKLILINDKSNIGSTHIIKTKDYICQNELYDMVIKTSFVKNYKKRKYILIWN